MYTIAETPTFVADADKLWTETERMEFFVWLAANPEAGDVVPKSGGCRKVRWSRAGTGKHGGVRIIYFTGLSSGVQRDGIPGHLLKAVRKEIENG